MKTQKIRVVIDKLRYSPFLFDVKVDGFDWAVDVNLNQDENAISLYREIGFNFNIYNGKTYVIHPTQIKSYIDNYVNIDEYQHKIMCDLSEIDIDIVYKEDGNIKIHLEA